MADSESSPLNPRRVLNRDSRPALILGLSLGEYGILAATLFLLPYFRLGWAFGSGVFLLVYLFLTRLRRELPDNYLSNFVRFWFRAHYHYRASEPDTEAKPYFLDALP